MKETALDLEHQDENDARLTNDAVSSLTWEKIRVELGHSLVSDLPIKPIISKIDGVAMAGIVKFPSC